MKTQLDDNLDNEYRFILWHAKCRLIKRYGSQKAASKVIGIDPTSLSKILSGTVGCNSKLFYMLLHFAKIDVSVNPLSVYGNI